MSLIQATNIRRSFGQGDLKIEVLKGIDFSVTDGEFVGIMGKSGAGKSTLLYQISLLDQPTSGHISVAGTNIISLNEQERTAFRLNTLGYVFQDYALVPDLNAEENVLLPLLMRGTPYPKARSTSRQSLDEVGLENKYHNMPSTLSGGEQQRVAVARAVAGTPRILFADEPTANLDSVSGQQIIDLLTCLNRDHNLTIIMVTHEQEYATNCHRILSMEDGQIAKEKKQKQ